MSVRVWVGRCVYRDVWCGCGGWVRRCVGGDVCVSVSGRTCRLMTCRIGGYFFGQV